MNDDPVLYALYRLAFNASLRKGELLGLRWTDIDLVDNTVTVVQTRTVVKGRIIVGTPKSRRSRRSEKIDQETTNALARLKDAQEASEQASGGKWWSDYVATDLLGKPLHPLTFTRTFQRYGEALGLPRITMHEVRHTSVFIGEMSGVGITTMSGRLGHADPGFTLRTYSPYLKSADTNGADAIGLSFDRAMRQAKLDSIRYKLDSELQKSPETTRHENDENDTDIELNATTQRETLEATPGIEPSYDPYEATL
jgi:integrase